MRFNYQDGSSFYLRYHFNIFIFPSPESIGQHFQIVAPLDQMDDGLAVSIRYCFKADA